MLTAGQLSQKVHRYLPEADTAIIERAYVFARKAHEGQFRHSGEPYFSHCVATARHVIEMELDPVTIAAGLLHDVPEDTAVTLEEIRASFGDEVAFLVDGVTKLSKVRLGQSAATAEELDREVASAENLRKMLLAMAQDIRVVLIKLADRMHNMETLEAVPEQKRRRIAVETMEIYAPLAERLGMGQVKGQLQDLAFPFVDPEGYAWVKAYAAAQFAETDRYLRRVMRFVEQELERQKITGSVHGRAKHLYSLYHKLRGKEQDLSKIYDLIAVRVLVEDVPTCYETLGMLHQHWKPLLGRIKDYIALPKPNGYQSLHTTVFCLEGRVVEFQIRTHQMHREAEFGIAAHWGYKEQVPAAQLKTGGSRALAWVEQLAKWQAEVSSSEEFLEALKIDTFRHRIFVFTPRGEVKDLPAGATPLDFAYAIHSKVGDHCYGAKINGKLSTLSTVLVNGDVVEILTSAKSSPKRGWLDMTITSGARSNIRKALRMKEAEQAKLLPEPVIGVDSVEQVPVQRQPLLIQPQTTSSSEVSVAGMKGYLIHMAKCCHPQLGDSIVGIVTVGKGISVHQRWCKNVREVGELGRMVPVSWDGQLRKRAALHLEAYDRNGLTRDIAAVVSAAGLSIAGFSGETQEDQTVHYAMTVEGNAEQDVVEVVKRLEGLPNIYLVERV